MAFYLFPGNTFLRLKSMSFSSSYAVKEPYKLYKLFSRQYLGFGSLFQFIPGTNANKARVQLTSQLNLAIEKSIKKHGLSPFYVFVFFNLGDFETLLDDIGEGFNYPKNERPTFKEFFLNVPIITDILNDRGKIKKSAIKNVLHSILNPAKILEDTLHLVHMVINRILDIGTTKDSNVIIPLRLVKGLIALAFGFIQMPVKIIKHIIDVPLNIGKGLITHFAGSIKDAYNNRNTKVLMLTVGELRAVKEARQQANSGVSDYSTITKKTHNTKYYGATKGKAYSKDLYATDSKTLMALKGSPDKIAQTTSFLSEINNPVKKMSNSEKQSTFTNS